MTFVPERDNGKYPDVAFVGVGSVGAPLARNLLKAGIRVVAFDTDPRALSALAAEGASSALSPMAAAKDVGVIFLCVATENQLRSAVTGPDGVLAGARKGAVIVIHSTVGPATVQELASAAQEIGVDVVDAPLTGGTALSEGRKAFFMVGGSDDAFERCRRLIELSARRIVRAGMVGSGTRAKLVHQLILCGNMVAAQEGWALGLAAGLESSVIKDVIVHGAAQGRVAEHLPEMRLGAHAAMLFEKDLDLCLTLGEQVSVSLPGTAVVRNLVKASLDIEING